MGKNLLLILAAFLAVFFIPQTAQAQETRLVMAGISGVLKTEPIQLDNRVEKLTAFLEKYDSPLGPYAETFVFMADKYQIDWKLLPAISGVESTFGKQIPYNSYNAYGWNNGNYRFQSWENSIEIVSQALKEKYYNRGLDNPYKIGRVYAPPSPFWGKRVDNFMKTIDSFPNNNPLLTLVLTI
ncbi:hypothetical protein MUP35_02025 [Patescibacteria group bacterium]|nr:hypothetical protein [Patescibacteria group bacterium]